MGTHRQGAIGSGHDEKIIIIHKFENEGGVTVVLKSNSVTAIETTSCSGGIRDRARGDEHMASLPLLPQNCASLLL